MARSTLEQIGYKKMFIFDDFDHAVRVAVNLATENTKT